VSNSFTNQNSNVIIWILTLIWTGLNRPNWGWKSNTAEGPYRCR